MTVAAPKASPEAQGGLKPDISAPFPTHLGLKPPTGPVDGETLSYTVDFLGITVGYARFQYSGTVPIDGKLTHHLKVNAWTSGLLSYVYPVSETIEYFLDVNTILPVRIEFKGNNNKRDTYAVYDQENSKIVYFFSDDGSISKTVDIISPCFDPVSVFYYFRWKYSGRDEKPLNVYGGRKVYQVAARVAGSERLSKKRGSVDTVIIEPIIWREGNPQDKGDHRMWLTDDGLRVPMKIYGKFRKIKEWTLVGELIPEKQRRAP